MRYKIIQIIKAPPGYFAHIHIPTTDSIANECKVICLALVEDKSGCRKVLPMRHKDWGAELELIDDEIGADDIDSEALAPHSESLKWELFFQ